MDLNHPIQSNLPVQVHSMRLRQSKPQENPAPKDQIPGIDSLAFGQAQSIEIPTPHFDTSNLDGEIANAIRTLEMTFEPFAMSAGTGSESASLHNGSINSVGLEVGGVGRNGTSLSGLRNQMIPRTKQDRIKRAGEWSEEDDFLSAILEVKTDFSIMGIDFRAKPEEGTGLDSFLSTGKSEGEEKIGLAEEEKNSIKAQIEFQSYISSFTQRWDFEAIARDLFLDWFTYDSMVLYWRVELDQPVDINAQPEAEFNEVQDEESKEALMPGLIQVYSLSPKCCRWENSDGGDHLFYKLPESLVKKIRGALSVRDNAARQRSINNLIENDGVPHSWIIQLARNGTNEVELSRDDGDNWIVIPKKRKLDGLSDPSMKTIFPYLEIRKAVKDGDLAAAYMMKHFILHVTMGESIEAGPLAGQRTNWAKPTETKQMYDVITRTTQTARLVTNHTVKFHYIFPPKEMWEEAKYHKAEFAISNWAGVSMVILAGDGSTNSSGYISAKRLIANIIYARRRIKFLFSEFFQHISIRERMVVARPPKTSVLAHFDENVLKEPRQLLDEIKLMLAEGLTDPLTATQELGRDPNAIRVRKLECIALNERTDLYTPLNPAFAQDLRNREGVSGHGAGRPPNPGTEVDEDTRNQPPLLK